MSAFQPRSMQRAAAVMRHALIDDQEAMQIVVDEFTSSADELTDFLLAMLNLVAFYGVRAMGGEEELRADLQRIVLEHSADG